MKCKKCGAESNSATYCPFCGEKMKKPAKKNLIVLALVVVLAFIFIGVANSNEPNAAGSAQLPGSTQASGTTEQEYLSTTMPEDNDATVGEKNAVKKAESYLRFSAFSYEGLKEQLEFEGFTEEEAIYGVDHCGADWNEQAVKKAKSYLNYSAFSYEGLKEQLEFEGFTEEEAVSGVENCEADWNEQAAKKAKSYLDYGSFSRAGLIEQLEFEGFTTEQAIYGVEANGF